MAKKVKNRIAVKPKKRRVTRDVTPVANKKKRKLLNPTLLCGEI